MRGVEGLYILYFNELKLLIINIFYILPFEYWYAFKIIYIIDTILTRIIMINLHFV